MAGEHNLDPSQPDTGAQQRHRDHPVTAAEGHYAGPRHEDNENEKPHLRTCRDLHSRQEHDRPAVTMCEQHVARQVCGSGEAEAGASDDGERYVALHHVRPPDTGVKTDWPTAGINDHWRRPDAPLAALLLDLCHAGAGWVHQNRDHDLRARELINADNDRTPSRRVVVGVDEGAVLVRESLRPRQRRAQNGCDQSDPDDSSPWHIQSPSSLTCHDALSSRYRGRSRCEHSFDTRSISTRTDKVILLSYGP